MTARSHVQYSRPDPTDRLGFDFDAAGRLTVPVLEELGVPLESGFYLCGPPAFLADFTARLADRSVAHERIHTEVFGSGKSNTPGVEEAPRRPPHALSEFHWFY
jgi:ferredoxin-NADP reductase